MKLKSITLAIMSAMCAMSSVAAPTQLDSITANLKFMAEHPVVAKIAPPKRMNVPMREFRSPSANLPAKAPQQAALPVMWGNIVNQSTWTGRYTGYGVYEFNPIENFALKTLKTGTERNMNANGGGVAIGDRYYATYWYMGMGEIISVFNVYDLNTWELIKSTNTDDGGTCATDLAYDRINDVCYGAFFTDDLNGWELATVDFSAGYPDKTTIGRIPLMVAALAVNSKGELYGICEDGVLYKFDTTDASYTRIGDTGIKVAGYGGVTQQSGAFDQHSDIFYWTSVDAYGNYRLYSVNTNDASVKLVSDIPDRSQILNIQVLAPSAADKAPNFLQNMEVSFPNGELSGTVSFTTPSATYDGNALDNNLTYTISVNGQVMDSGATTADTQESKQITVEQGECLFEVWVENSVGRSPIATYTMWVGPDTPSITSVNYTANGNESTVSWTPAETGIHGGWVGDISYTVYRLPGQVTVAEGIRETTIVDIIPEDAPLAQYEYSVVPSNAGLVGGAVISNGNVVGDAIQPPYLQTFDDEISFTLMKVIDVNKDGATWKWAEQSWSNPQGVASCDDPDGGYSTPYDDWLLTPQIKLEEGKSYELSFKARSMAWDPDYISVAFGEGDDVTKYRTVLTPTKMEYAMGFKEYKATIIPTKDQKARIGFHRTADYADSYLQIDDIRLTEGATLTAPGAITNFNVKAQETGQLTATVSLTAPSVDKAGNPLTSITAINVYCDNELEHTFTNPAPGSDLSCEVSVGDNGTHTFIAEAVNDGGTGESVTAKQFVGVDVPGTFSAWIEDHDTFIKVCWTPCTIGQNGYYVNPDEMVYDLYTSDGTLVGELIASDLTGTSVDINYDTNEGQMGGLIFAMRARNSVGSSRGVSTDMLIVGAPYELPYEEHFEGTSGYMYEGDTDQYFNTIEGQSSDGDNFCFGYMAVGNADEYRNLRSLKIDIQDLASPHLTFDYRLTSNGRIEAYVITPDRNMTLVNTANEMSDGTNWKTCVTDLSQYADERYVRICFRFYKGDGMYDVISIDNIHLLDALKHDLSAAITLPATAAEYGRNADINVNVRNNGIETCPAYEVQLFADDELIDSQQGSAIEFMKEANHHFVYNVKAGIEGPVNMRAEVIYADDEDLDNNVSEDKLEIAAPKVSAPENLSASEAAGIKLDWNAPTDFYRERIVEDFESYQPWTITNFGKWTLVDADGGSVISLGDADFPNEGKPQAFTIFNPSSIGVPDGNKEANPHSGNQYAACFAAKVMEVSNNDDWLISPLLPGTAQKIGFYAKQMIPDYGAEKLQVLYSTTGMQTSDFTLIEEFEISNYNNWERFTANLPEGSKYFALRVVTRDGHMCMIDDVTFMAGSCTDIVAYNIYRDKEYVTRVDAPATTYTDAEGKAESNYNVTAVYATGEESGFSNTVSLSSFLDEITIRDGAPYNVYSIDGKVLMLNSNSLEGLEPGLYIINKKKVFITK